MREVTDDQIVSVFDRYRAKGYKYHQIMEAVVRDTGRSPADIDEVLYRSEEWN